MSTQMIVKPRVRGFVCVTAHPQGCAQHVRDQIDYVRAAGKINGGPGSVLVIGASTGYGLATRIVSAFGSGASTIGVFYEKPAENGRTASAGWYNSVAFEEQARAAGLISRSLNGDAFSDEMKERVINVIKHEIGKVDLVVYSLASPRRVDPKTGAIYKSTLKPIGQSFTANTLDTDKKQVTQVSIEPATQDDIDQTVKVMGGEDWELWMQALLNAGVLAEGCKTVAYDYIGPELTWPVYTNGTIGAAKKHLRQTAAGLNKLLEPIAGSAAISVNKAVVTQASSAIPVVPLYISILFKVMKAAGTHEDCIEQMHRLFEDRLYAPTGTPTDEANRIRLDDWEMRPEIQKAVFEIWPEVKTETLYSLTDFAGYQKNFLQLFGYEFEGINYDEETEIEVSFPPGALIS